ncbi:MAG TPA: serine hydrolase [Blastocatellia bacterium]|jgi:CubicO group peptidase (beta-lactamase class C family)
MRPIIARILLLVLVFSQGASGQSSVQPRIEHVEKGLLSPVLIKGDPGRTIQERMKFYKVPGVSIAVINDYKVEWARSYGVKDVETNEPVTTETLFQAASISKPVAAMTALKRVEQGKIALDQNINDKLTSWKLPDNEFTTKRKVTLANLLSHTGGLTVHGFPGYAVGEKIPTLPQILDGAAPANTAAVRVDMEPATKFRYSGGGTTIAQLAIMDIEKKPFPQIAQETVLGPLGMTNSTYSQPLPAETRKKAASGHRGNGKPVEGKIHVYPEMAPAGLWTTPTDLARFAIEVQLSLAGKSNKVLSKEMTTKMVTPFISDNVGMGFFIEKHGQATYFGHSGANEGFRSQLLVNRDKGYGAAVMVNSDNGEIMNEIIRAIAKEYQWEDYLPQPLEIVSVDPARLDGYAGRFLVNPDWALTVTKENGKLYAELTLSPKVELLALSESEFTRTDANVQYAFAKGEDGKVDSVKIRFTGGTTEARRLAQGELIPYEKLIAGNFAEAIEAYKKIKRETPNNDAVAEERLNSDGYSLLEQKKIADAIAVFKVNVELYPQSSNVYDSLGEAYMANGEKELAIANYKKSLELDPKNKNAVEMLKKLERR